jgi:hypothetical protein
MGVAACIELMVMMIMMYILVVPRDLKLLVAYVF